MKMNINKFILGALMLSVVSQPLMAFNWCMPCAVKENKYVAAVCAAIPFIGFGAWFGYKKYKAYVALKAAQEARESADKATAATEAWRDKQGAHVASKQAEANVDIMEQNVARAKAQRDAEESAAREVQIATQAFKERQQQERKVAQRVEEAAQRLVEQTSIVNEIETISKSMNAIDLKVKQFNEIFASLALKQRMIDCAATATPLTFDGIELDELPDRIVKALDGNKKFQGGFKEELAGSFLVNARVIKWAIRGKCAVVFAKLALYKDYQKTLEEIVAFESELKDTFKLKFQVTHLADLKTCELWLRYDNAVDKVTKNNIQQVAISSKQAYKHLFDSLTKFSHNLENLKFELDQIKADKNKQLADLALPQQQQAAAV